MAITIDDKFREQIESTVGCAVILAGSGSDKPHIEKISAALKDKLIPHQVKICSAHKQPGLLKDVIDAYDAVQGPLAYIAVAGGTDALSGTVSFHSYRPTISCPPDHPNDTCLRNPPGSSNAYMASQDSVAEYLNNLFTHLVKKEDAECKAIILTKADDPQGVKIAKAVQAYGLSPTFEYEGPRPENTSDRMQIEVFFANNSTPYQTYVDRCTNGPTIFVTGHNNPVSMTSATAYVVRPDNAARFAAQIFASINPAYKKIILDNNAAKIKELEAADEKFKGVF